MNFIKLIFIILFSKDIWVAVYHRLFGKVAPFSQLSLIAFFSIFFFPSDTLSIPFMLSFACVFSYLVVLGVHLVIDSDKAVVHYLKNFHLLYLPIIILSGFFLKRVGSQIHFPWIGVVVFCICFLIVNKIHLTRFYGDSAHYLKKNIGLDWIFPVAISLILGVILSLYANQSFDFKKSESRLAVVKSKHNGRYGNYLDLRLSGYRSEATIRIYDLKYSKFSVGQEVLVDLKHGLFFAPYVSLSNE